MKSKKWLGLCLILILSFLAYYPCLKGEFLSDEYLLILDNPRIQYPSGFRDFFLEKFWSGKFRGIYYRPLVLLSYSSCWKLCKDNPWGYHLFNLLVHLGVVLLFFFLAQRILGKPALLASAIFAFHPAHSEAVCWIPARTDLLAGFFVLFAWVLWLKREEKQGLKRIVIYLGVGLFYLAGLFSKEMAITLPAFLFIYDWWQERENGLKKVLKKDWIGYLIFGLVLVIYLVLRELALSRPGPPPAVNFLSQFPFWKKPLVIARILLEYLRLGLFPYPNYLDWYYTNRFSQNYPLALFLASGVFWLGVIFWLIRAWRKRNSAGLFAGLWLASLLPVMHILSFPNAMAERFFYLPGIFFSLGLAWILERYFLQTKLAKGIIFSLLGFYFLLSFFSARHYQTRLQYFREGVRQTPNEKIIHNYLGQAYLERGWLENAEREFLWAISLEPNYVEAWNNLGLVKIRRGDLESAEKALKTALSINPNYEWSHYNLGLVLKRKGRSEEAGREFLLAYQLSGFSPKAGYQLAEILFEQGEISQAKSLLDQILQNAGWHLASIKLRLKIALKEKDRGKILSLLELAEKYQLKDPLIEEIKNRF